MKSQELVISWEFSIEEGMGLPLSELVLQKGDKTLYQYVFLRMLSQKDSCAAEGSQRRAHQIRLGTAFLEKAILEVNFVR